MAIIALVIGAILYFRGKISVGSFKAQGKHVKDAGLVLMLPAAGSFFLGMGVGLLFLDNPRGLMSVVNVLLVVELMAVFIAIFVAYRLIVNPVGYPNVTS